MSDVDEEFPNGVAREAKEELIRTSQRYGRRSVAIVALAAVMTVFSSSTSLFVGLGNRRLQERIRDCSDPGGKCYQRNQAATAQAVQSILDYIDRSITPFRTANEAQNLCQIAMHTRNPPVLEVPAERVIAEYHACIEARSAGTERPPLPPNPLLTTTTTREGKAG